MICVTNNYSLYRTFEANGKIKSEKIGMAVFPFASLFNHSCAPNVSRINLGSKMYLVVKRSIKAGEQLFNSYGRVLAIMENWNLLENPKFQTSILQAIVSGTLSNP